MREIKFRAWDKVEKVMYVPTDLFLCMDGKTWAIDQDSRYGKSHHQNAENVALMQFTGLQDKNGIEIYEGDIVRNHRRILAVVEWGEGGCGDCGYRGIVLNGAAEADTNSAASEHWEIVGNIYENHELLK